MKYNEVVLSIFEERLFGLNQLETDFKLLLLMKTSSSGRLSLTIN